MTRTPLPNALSNPEPASRRTQYVQATAGAGHTALLRSDGEALAFGVNVDGRCDVPALPPGTQYVQATAGVCHTVLLRSDGQAVAFGWNADGRCDVPELPPNAGVARAVNGGAPQFGATRLIRWGPATHGFFPGASQSLVRATLLVHARLALVPKHLLLEFGQARLGSARRMPGSCVACDATTHAVSIASNIAGFCSFHPACRIRAASKSNGFLQLPPAVIKFIGEMLPKTPLHATLLSTRLPWLSLRPRLFPPA